MPAICRVYGELKIKQLYRCADCGAPGLGDSVTVVIDSDSATTVADNLNQMPLRAHDMPMGWASFLGPRGSTIFKCPACLSSNH